MGPRRDLTGVSKDQKISQKVKKMVFLMRKIHFFRDRSGPGSEITIFYLVQVATGSKFSIFPCLGWVSGFLL